MSTFGTMQAEIADDLARSDLTNQIKNAIKSAIRYYESHRYTFNEKQDDFSLVVNQKDYDSTDLTEIPTIFAIDSLKVNANGTDYSVLEKDFSFIDKISTTTSTVGDPIYFALYEKKLWFYPTPSNVRTVTISFAYKFPALSADADTNAWMTDGYDLIKSRAKADLYDNVLHDYTQADRMRGRCTELNNCLTAEYESRIGGNLKATSF